MPRAEELDIQFIDEQQFIERIFFQYKAYVKHLARNKCGNPNDVEDVVQCTWELLLKNVDKLFAVSENKQMAYIAAVVTNVIRMEARKKKLDTCSLDDVLILIKHVLTCAAYAAKGNGETVGYSVRVARDEVFVNRGRRFKTGYRKRNGIL